MGYQGQVVIRAKINKDALIIDLHCIVKGDSANAAPLVWLFKMTYVSEESRIGQGGKYWE